MIINMDIKRNEIGKFVHLYQFDEEFFDIIDTEVKAYILGFFYADGCNFTKEHIISFTQLEQDKDILEKIKLAMNSNYPLHEIIQTSNNKKKYTLSMRSKHTSDVLCKLGAVNSKSLTLQFPSIELFQNEDLLRHFVRGYFDGDGCIWNGKRKKMVVKDPKTKTGVRERIVHNVKFTFTGNFAFINALQDFLVKEGIVKRKTKLNFSKANNPNNSTTENVCTMEYSGRGQIKNLFDFMYTGASIYGQRKFNKFEEIFCALEEKSSEDTSLIAGKPEMATSSQASIIEEGSTTIPEMGVDSSESKCEAPNE